MATRVLLIEASGYTRQLIRSLLESDSTICVVGEAGDGKEALLQAQETSPEVVVLDLDMPDGAGLACLERLLSVRPCPVVATSALCTEEVVRALELGAVEFVPKPSGKRLREMTAFRDDLTEKVATAARIGVQRLLAKARSGGREAPAADGPLGSPEQVIVIGASTGGPKALCRLFASIPSGFRSSILVVQHMPVGFPELLAARLAKAGPLAVRVARDGDRPSSGEALLAPGGLHMLLEPGGVVRLTEEAPLMGIRPAADLTMASAARVLRERVVGVVLTGMGKDGTAGLQAIRRHGGFTVAESEESCVVFGMPASAIQAGCVDVVVPIDEVIPTILSRQEKEERCA